jgi:hypothetical protein
MATAYAREEFDLSQEVSAFAKWENKAWPYVFKATLVVRNLAGGIPSDQDIARAWIKTRLKTDDSQLEAQVAEVMAERNVSRDAAVEEISRVKHLVGFKADKDKGLFVEGRQLKACIKEGAMVALAAGKFVDGSGKPKDRWGLTKKGTQGFMAEHIQVEEDRLYLGRMEPDVVEQSFPKNPRTQQTGIQYMEIVEKAYIHATISSDWPFTDQEWAMILLTAGKQGFGASRSQGHGKFVVTEFKQIELG